MATSYPAGIDNFTNPQSNDALASPSHSDQHADTNDAIEAIQNELGTNPAGSHDDVKSRLNDVDRRLQVSATEPSDPEVDDVWVDISGGYGSPALKVFNGVDWAGGS